MEPPQGKTLEELWENSHLAAGNAAYLEYLYDAYLADPQSIEENWRAFFDSLKVEGSSDLGHSVAKESFRFSGRRPYKLESAKQRQQEAHQVSVLQLINAYRFRGHQKAQFNPIEVTDQATAIPELDLAYYGLTEEDLDSHFNSGSLTGPTYSTLREILHTLNRTYCGSIGAEYMHITDTEEKRWIQEFIESRRGDFALKFEEKKEILQQLTAAEGLEQYLHNKYLGQKRFSLEGADSLIPMLKSVLHHASAQGCKEVIIGMAHRGRLNVLVNIMGKTPNELFREFEGKIEHPEELTGDVKYHLGFSSDFSTPTGPLHVALAFNPSHLEIVGPVVEGSVRARQDRRQDKNGQLVIPVVIHGDAAFSGQGVVMETFNMSQSRGYSTKGTIHIVINNQIGFTTSVQADARSTIYCTDVAKMVNAPIFHVNGDDPEAVVFVAQLAIAYRNHFHKDIVIDLVCYRRHGHNEADEPMVTQPTMYQQIRHLATVRQQYFEKLLQENILAEGDGEYFMDKYLQALDKGHSVVSGVVLESHQSEYHFHKDWAPYLERMCSVTMNTGVALETLRDLYQKLQSLPADFQIHPQVKKIMDNRQLMIQGDKDLDWGMAETLAYATLINEGYPIRISGQDSGRGTFFHRHATLHNQANREVYIPLRNMAEEQADFLVINSLLSEAAVLAFEYGYATTNPKTLTIWEAQFGDFANGAQVVIDQFITAGEQKWDRLCGLVMFLPHGYEGQGPEHSSARLERYLQLCAQHNIQVCQPTTSAQIFHLLRRHMLMSCRKPLIVMTPKSLLRHKYAASPLAEFTNGQFKFIIPDDEGIPVENVRRIVLCSGKVYYDLIDKRNKDKRNDVAIIRIEQLYPFPEAVLRSELAKYPNVVEYVWCQEEPMNQGAWYSSQHHMRSVINHEPLHYAGRPSSAAPAVGLPAVHLQQLKQLIKDALG